MILAIDAGNSRIKWGLRRSGAWVQLGSCATLDGQALADWAASLRDHAFERILVSNVAGADAKARIEAVFGGAASVPQFIVSQPMQCGVRSSYDEPGQLGCDRWAALIGAHALLPGALLVVNAGTALTVDALTEEGLFLGGIIAPGIELMRRALDEHTAGLKLRPGEVRFFPSNTGDAIMSGAVHAAAGAIERMGAFMREGGHESLRVVLSGGSAGLLQPMLSLPAVVVDNLVLEGLATIAEEDE
jgi:type III pantothenate kinase